MILVQLLLALPRSAQEPGIPLARAAEVFAEVEEAAMDDGGKLWGHELLGPLLLADPVTRAVAANQPDEQGQLVEREGVFVGTLPAEVGVANTALDWSGVRWTMVMWPLPAERHARTRLCLHECFHRIQPALGHGGGDTLSLHLDGEAGRTWLRLEFRALARALSERDAARREASEDALCFRARRRAEFAGAAAKEAAFERNEGLAEYTGLKLCGLDGPALAVEAARKLRQDESAASFVRSFAYATGPAYGLLLDELGADWRGKIEPGADLSALLASALGWTAPAELEAEAARRAERHGGAEVAADERARALARAAVDARNRQRFVDGPVLELSFTAKMSYSFDFNAITPLAGAGSVYGDVRAVDAWGILDASTGGALFVSGPDGGFRSARVPAPRDPAARPLAGDGWTLALEPGWTLAAGEREGDWKLVRAP